MLVDFSALTQKVETAQNEEELRVAIEQLIATRSSEVIPVLIRSLRCTNSAICDVIVEGLVSYGEPAVPVIIKNLDDHDYAARYQGIRALVQLAHPDSFDTFVWGLTEDFAPSVRRASAKGLGVLQDPRAIPVLLSMINDPDWAVRYAVVIALESFVQDPTVQQALVQAKEDSDRVVRLKATEILKKLGA
jgi:phycocyanobilin lyase subunit beta